jgi:G3E family GTPase
VGTALIPCILVSGYLGAGKTTLINQFLSAPNGLRAVVLVNDFEKGEYRRASN